MARPYEGLYQGMKPAGLPAQLATSTAKSGGRYLWCGPPGSAPNRDCFRMGQRAVASLLQRRLVRAHAREGSICTKAGCWEMSDTPRLGRTRGCRRRGRRRTRDWVFLIVQLDNVFGDIEFVECEYDRQVRESGNVEN